MAQRNPLNGETRTQWVCTIGDVLRYHHSTELWVKKRTAAIRYLELIFFQNNKNNDNNCLIRQNNQALHENIKRPAKTWVVKQTSSKKQFSSPLLPPKSGKPSSDIQSTWIMNISLRQKWGCNEIFLCFSLMLYYSKKNTPILA